MLRSSRVNSSLSGLAKPASSQNRPCVGEQPRRQAGVVSGKLLAMAIYLPL